MPQGITLLQRRGLPEWLEAWRQGPPPEARAAAGSGAPIDLAAAVRVDAALVLAGMALKVLGG